MSAEASFIGSLGLQNADSVNITGGDISGVPAQFSLFTPPQLTSLKCWIDGELVPGQVGDKVPRAVDKTRYGNDLTQGTADNQPTIAVDAWTDRRYMHFDGVNSGMHAVYSRTVPRTVFVVFKCTSTPSSPMVITAGTSVSSFVAARIHDNFEGGWYMTGDNQGTYIFTSNRERWFDTWQILELVYEELNSTSFMYLNGRLIGSVTNQDNDEALGIDIAANSADEVNFIGGIAEVLDFDGVLSSGDRATVRDYLSRKWFATQHHIYCLGDSLTFGSGSTDPTGDNQSLWDDYPSQLRNTIRGHWDTVNLGIGGHVLSQISTAYTSFVQPVLPTHGQNVVVLWGGTNDLITRTAAATIADYWTLCDLIRADGCKVIAVDVLKRTDSDIEAKRVAFNAAQLAAWEDHADGLIRLSEDSRFSTPNDGTYYSDNVHLTVLGYRIVARYVAEKANALVAS